MPQSQKSMQKEPAKFKRSRPWQAALTADSKCPATLFGSANWLVSSLLVSVTPMGSGSMLADFFVTGKGRGLLSPDQAEQEAS